MITSFRPIVRLAPSLVACGVAIFGFCASVQAAEEPAHSAELDAMIIAQAKRHGVPEKLVRRIVMRESRYNPRARNHSFWGLMQISYPTAKSMGFKGSPQELLNPLVNLTYAVPYLANAFVIAGKQEDAAVRLYAAGYYDTARTRGLLGVLRTANSDPIRGDGAPSEQPPILSTAYNTTTASAAPVPISMAPPNGRPSDGGVDMIVDKNGNSAPPKKWQHDGGTSVIARGEQGIEQIAAYAQANGALPDEHKRVARSHAKKNVTFAAIEAPPADAQAYAAASGGDSRALQAESQAAIAQATAGRPETAGDATAPSSAATSADADTPPKKHSSRSARKHSNPKDETTKVAKAEPAERSKVASKHDTKKTAASPKKADALALRQTNEDH